MHDGMAEYRSVYVGDHGTRENALIKEMGSWLVGFRVVRVEGCIEMVNSR